MKLGKTLPRLATDLENFNHRNLTVAVLVRRATVLTHHNSQRYLLPNEDNLPKGGKPPPNEANHLHGEEDPTDGWKYVCEGRFPDEVEPPYDKHFSKNDKDLNKGHIPDEGCEQDSFMHKNEGMQDEGALIESDLQGKPRWLAWHVAVRPTS